MVSIRLKNNTLLLVELFNMHKNYCMEKESSSNNQKAKRNCEKEGNLGAKTLFLKLTDELDLKEASWAFTKQ